MKLEMVSRFEAAKNVANKWYGVYFQNYVWRFGEDKEDIYYNLVALGDNPHPDVVDYTIGNRSWTSRSCTSCGESFNELILIGEVDYDNESAYICKPCCETALKMFEGEEK